MAKRRHLFPTLISAIGRRKIDQPIGSHDGNVRAEWLKRSVSVCLYPARSRVRAGVGAGDSPRLPSPAPLESESRLNQPLSGQLSRRRPQIAAPITSRVASMVRRIEHRRRPMARCAARAGDSVFRPANREHFSALAVRITRQPDVKRCDGNRSGGERLVMQGHRGDLGHLRNDHKSHTPSPRLQTHSSIRPARLSVAVQPSYHV